MPEGDIVGLSSDKYRCKIDLLLEYGGALPCLSFCLVLYEKKFSWFFLFFFLGCNEMYALPSTMKLASQMSNYQ